MELKSIIQLLESLDKKQLKEICHTCIDLLEDSTKVKRKSSRFIHPSLEEVSSYCKEIKSCIDPQQFVDFYSSKGWMVGKSKMKDWKAAVRNWSRNQNKSYAYKPPVLNNMSNTDRDAMARLNDEFSSDSAGLL